jgi:hypothetical protein
MPDEALFCCYPGRYHDVCRTYIRVRTSHVERWDRDGHDYVILPQSTIVYYVYRSLTYIDTQLTGMRFHIGPHRE